MALCALIGAGRKARLCNEGTKRQWEWLRIFVPARPVETDPSRLTRRTNDNLLFCPARGWRYAHGASPPHPTDNADDYCERKDDRRPTDGRMRMQSGAWWPATKRRAPTPTGATV